VTPAFQSVSLKQNTTWFTNVYEQGNRTEYMMYFCLAIQNLAVTICTTIRNIKSSAVCPQGAFMGSIRLSGQELLYP
jgi:hypothetical protein